MKRMKKLASLMLALVMALALAVPAMAAEDDVTLTINNPISGHTYGAFQIFTGTVGAEEGNELTMSNVKWGSGIKVESRAALAGDLGVTPAEGEDVNSDAFAQKVAEAMQGRDGAALADIIAKYLTDATDYESVFHENTEDSTKSNYTITMPAGYYLIKDIGEIPTRPDGATDTATDYILQVLNDESVKPKADGTPVVEKKIKEGEDLKDTTSTGIGEVITFQLKATLPEAVASYKEYYLQFVDTLSEGLTYVGDYTVTMNGEEVPATAYTVVPPEGDNGGTLTVTFEDVKRDLNAKGNEVIIVEYKARLNSSAIVGGNENGGNLNDVLLKYSRDPNYEGHGEPPTGETPKDTVVVFTYKLDNNKVDGSDHTTPLAGVKFILGKPDETAPEGKTWANVVDGKIVDWNQTAETATELKSDENGMFNVAGLGAGTYYLRETYTLDGYNMLTQDITIKIDADLNVTWDLGNDAYGENGLTITVGEGQPVDGDVDTGVVNNQIENNRGATLPETGGIGTTIFYVLGGLLTVGAVVLLVTKKRMSVEEK